MITTLSGTNGFRIREELKKRVSEFVKTHTDMGLERYDGEELDAQSFITNIQAMPFLVDKRLIIVRNLSRNKALSEQIEHIVKSVPESTDLLLIEDKLDKRLTYFKTLKKQTEFLEFNQMDEPELIRWLVTEAAAASGKLSSADARYLVERIGPNQLMLHNELQKLLTYDPAITRESIDGLTDPSPQSTVFQLLEAAFAGNSKRSLELYREQRQLKVEPQAIMGLIGWQLHILALIKAAGNHSVDEIAEEAKLNPFVVRKSYAVAHKLTMVRLKELIAEALKLDVKMKTQPIDADEALQYLLISISRQ